MIGFFKAAFKRSSGSGTGSGLGSPGAKPSMKVTPKGKTSRYRTFHKDEKGNEHGNRILVQDEDDNWYSEERNSKTGEVGYREYKVGGAATDAKYDSITGKMKPVAEYDSKKQRIASDLSKYNQTLREEGGSISRSAGDPFASSVKGTKLFGDSVYLPPVEHRNAKTVERDRIDAPFKSDSFRPGPRVVPKKSSYDPSPWDKPRLTKDLADKGAAFRDLVDSGIPKPKTTAGDPFSAFRAKPKAPSEPKLGEGYDSFDVAVASPHVKPKPAGTESSGKSYSDADTDKWFSGWHRPERTFRVDPSGEATVNSQQSQTETQSTETDGQRRRREAAAKGRATAAANRAAKAAAAAAPPVTPKKPPGRPKKAKS